MEYTEAELKHWWSTKTKSDRSELLDLIAEKTGAFGESLLRQYEAGWDFSAKQLAAIRKWDS